MATNRVNNLSFVVHLYFRFMNRVFLKVKSLSAAFYIPETNMKERLKVIF